MAKGNAMVKVDDAMRMTAANESKYRPKCVTDMKILTITVKFGEI